MKTIIYLHGFGSSGQSGTVKHLRKVLPQFNVLAPDIPICPSVIFPKRLLRKVSSRPDYWHQYGGNVRHADA